MRCFSTPRKARQVLPEPREDPGLVDTLPRTVRQCVCVVSSGRSLHVSSPLAHCESSPEAEGMGISWGDLHNSASTQERGKEGASLKDERKPRGDSCCHKGQPTQMCKGDLLSGVSCHSVCSWWPCWHLGPFCHVRHTSTRAPQRPICLLRFGESQERAETL